MWFHNTDIGVPNEVIGTLGGDSNGKSEDDETPQSGFLEEAQREPVESVRLAWRSRCPLQPQRSYLFLIHFTKRCMHLNKKIASVGILFLLTNAIYCTTSKSLFIFLVLIKSSRRRGFLTIIGEVIQKSA